MSIDDIHAMVGSIRKNVLDMRVTNIYDLHSGGGGDGGSSKTYILKLHQPPFPKIFLLLESGVRFHTSKYARDGKAGSSALPSQFTMKLRKHLRGKRLVALQQLEGDRVVDFTFGSDALQCHLILELYAAGNIVLTDDKYNILSLLRTHRFDENVKVAVKQVYPIEVLGGSASAVIEDGADAPVVKKTAKERSIQTVDALKAVVDRWFEEQKAKATTGKKKQVQTLKQLLLAKDSTFGGLGPVIVEHCIVRAELTPTLKIRAPGEFAAIGDDKLAVLLEELHAGWDLLDKLQSEQINTSTVTPPDASTATENAAPTAKHGFIILKDSPTGDGPDLFEEFTPYLYAQHQQAHKKVREFDTFDEAVDEYFSRFEAEVAQVAKQNAQLAAENKLAKLKKNQQVQLAQLEEVQNQSLKHAQLIETNQQDVENVLLVIRSALASGMDWRELEELVRYEQKNGNPVASLIHKLDLESNRVSILLCDGDDDESEGDEDDEEKGVEDKQAHVIWIDLALSALANAREIYAKKKKAGAKSKKATEATERAIQHAEKNTKKTLQKQQMTRHVIYQRRKVMWFEKFHWFLTNENYLVIAGKDAHQNELLVKRYLRKGDVYVHADLHGAATCIVRNRVAPSDKKSPPPPIPVATLEQAGCMSVCRSNAWTSQVIAGAYWVHADQVSKTAPAGEYLTTGSFMIRGKKNFIPPSRLEMGLGIIFRVDESCIPNHTLPTAAAQELEAQAQAESEFDERAEAEPVPTQIKAADIVEETNEEGRSTREATDDAKPESSDNAVPDSPKGDDDEAIADDQDESAPTREGKKRLTAKERRDLKKGKAPGEPKETSNDNNKSQEQKSKNQTPANDSQKNVRGKKGKLKKMKKKYADQDEDDRQLRMGLLGHAVAADDKPVEDAEDEDVAEIDEVDGGETNVKPKKSREDNEEFIRQQREKKEKFLDEQEEEAETGDFFDAFTGAPLPNDIVLFALPMCAPYSSLGKYKYKVKITPGSQKKGKAAKQAMEHFLSSNLREEKDAATRSRKPKQDEEGGEKPEEDETTPDVDPVVVQRELMKCIPENELVNCLVGPLKISAPGLHGSSAGGKKGGGKKSSGGKKGKK